MARILAVDDDTLSLAIVEAVLDDLGHEVTATEDPAGALALASREAYDAVVSDLVMPGMDGLALFRALRAGGFQGPMVLLTGDDPAGILAREPGLAACVQKDVALEEQLGRALERILDGSSR